MYWPSSQFSSSIEPSQAASDNMPIGGIKVVTYAGWFAARPSGTEDLYKIYAESYLSADHLTRILDDAQAIVDGALSATEAA